MIRLFADIGLSHDNDHIVLGIEHHTILCRRLCFQLKDSKYEKVLKKKQQMSVQYIYN